jgi:Txe/YoeB family toxin of Txe-Axe toxin-antitoxin module
MSRKDFELIARVLRETTNGLDTPEPVRANIAKTFARELAADNPRFNRAHFLRATEA